LDCEQLTSRVNKYAAFHVIVEQNSEDVLEKVYSSDIWPTGTLFKRFFLKHDGSKN